MSPTIHVCVDVIHSLRLCRCCSQSTATQIVFAVHVCMDVLYSLRCISYPQCTVVQMSSTIYGYIDIIISFCRCHLQSTALQILSTIQVCMDVTHIPRLCRCHPQSTFVQMSSTIHDRIDVILNQEQCKCHLQFVFVQMSTTIRGTRLCRYHSQSTAV